MATANVKARKRARREAGYPVTTRHTRPEKTPTPLHRRAFLALPVFRKLGDALPIGAQSGSTYRSPSRVERFLLSGGTSR